MVSAGEGLHDIEEALHILAQLVERGATVITGHGIVHRFPQSFDFIDPRIVNGLEEQLEFRVGGQPLGHRSGFVNDVVVEHKDDAARDDTGSAARRAA